MPRLPINYQNALIYKIVCKDLDMKECYVGSTTDFRKRKAQHKSSCNTEERNLYNFIRGNGGWDNWDMVLIEKYPCDDRLELLKRERYWIEELSASLNKLRPILTTYETLNYNKIYYETNKDEIKNQQKEYYYKNKDKINKVSKEKYNCPCGGKHTRHNSKRHFKSKRHQEYIN
jgi:hypothetical protein